MRQHGDVSGAGGAQNDDRFAAVAGLRQLALDLAVVARPAQHLDALVVGERGAVVEQADTVAPVCAVRASHRVHRVRLVHRAQQRTPDTRVVERRVQMVEAHDADRPGRFGHLRRYRGTPCQQRHLVGADRLQPMDLAAQQRRGRRSGVVDRRPLHALDMGELRPCRVAWLALSARHVAGEPLIGGALAHDEIRRDKTVRAAADHLGDRPGRVGAGQALGHDDRGESREPRQRFGQMREGAPQAEPDRAVVRGRQLVRRCHQSLAEPVAQRTTPDARDRIARQDRRAVVEAKLLAEPELPQGLGRIHRMAFDHLGPRRERFVHSV